MAFRLHLIRMRPLGTLRRRLLSLRLSNVKSDLSIAWPIAAARILKMPPMEIAKKAADIISRANIESVDVAPPGFININLKKEFLLNNRGEKASCSNY
ncbi:MAG: hypothetical protein L6414_10030 [Hydrogenophaga sp.]|uniref:hypothetical protein n=1 Tax=Hydrogenophaga sp. TaxID=1904254 RepID=UPI0025B8A4B3|nr:hypothetical protein [Hydrogenophaga sp.]MCG2655786.1 hypothetical protein [Hydrogenophaga sp.]